MLKALDRQGQDNECCPQIQPQNASIVETKALALVSTSLLFTDQISVFLFLMNK